jgi:CHAT domain-containing protein
MPLGADLIVLSACDTGIGRQTGAEGLSSLARAFLSAGAATRVVSSLWEIEEEATAALMERFYASLLGDARLSPPAALRAAQLAIRRDPRWRDAYFWAGFVVQGNW